MKQAYLCNSYHEHVCTRGASTESSRDRFVFPWIRFSILYKQSVSRCTSHELLPLQQLNSRYSRAALGHPKNLVRCAHTYDRRNYYEDRAYANVAVPNTEEKVSRHITVHIWYRYRRFSFGFRVEWDDPSGVTFMLENGTPHFCNQNSDDHLTLYKQSGALIPGTVF